MKKILFVIHNMEEGGAQKVLVNLVNNLDKSKFDVSVMAIFGGGINSQFLNSDIKYREVFRKSVRGNRLFFRLFSPKSLYRYCVKDSYDIVVSYLEGITARVVSGCQDLNTKLVCWIHSTFVSIEDVTSPFRNIQEAQSCYERFDQIVCVSKWSEHAFCDVFPNQRNVTVLYNTIESDKIMEQSRLPVSETLFYDEEIKIIAVGSLKPVKAFDRLIRIHARLQKEGYHVHTYFLGIGPDLDKLKKQVIELGQCDTISFLGYDTNPYKYVARANLFVCCSLVEGFSTAATEALIVGTPICTVDVSGMKEMLGENNEYGVVTENSEEALYEGIRRMIDSREMLARYSDRAKKRGQAFSTRATVKAVEEMFESL